MGFTKPVLSGNHSFNSAFHKRLLRLGGGSTNTTNRTIQEALKKYERNKKRRARSERKRSGREKEANKLKEEEVTENKEPEDECEKKSTEETSNDSDENGMKEIKIPLDSLTRKSPSQYRPIDYLAESIELKKDNNNKRRPFSDRFAKAVEKLAKESFFICTVKKKPWR